MYPQDNFLNIVAYIYCGIKFILQKEVSLITGDNIGVLEEHYSM
jgi:hypothetical protein